MSDYKLTYTGDEVQSFLDQIYNKKFVEKTTLNNTLTNYVTKTDLSNATISFTTKSYVDGKVNPLASRDYVNDEINMLEIDTQNKINTAILPLASKTYVDNAISTLQPTLPNGTGEYATKVYVDDSIYNLANMTDAEIQQAVQEAKDYVHNEIIAMIKDYATELFVETTVINAVKDLPTKSYVDSYVDTTIKPYALKTEVDTKLLNYASREYVDQAIQGVESGDVDTSIYATKTYVQTYTENEITKAIQTMPDISYVNNAIISAIEPLASKDYVNTLISNLKPTDVDLSAYATITYVDNKVVGFVSLQRVNELITIATNNLASRTFVSDSISTAYTNISNNFALKSYVDTAVSSLASKTYVNNSITTALSTFATRNYVDTAITPLAKKTDLTSYATKTYVDSAIANVGSGGGTVDLSDYATKEFVINAIDDINFPTTDLTGYATQEYVNNAIEQAQLGSGESGVISPSGYQIWVGQLSEYETLVPNDKYLYFILQGETVKSVRNGEKYIESIFQGTNELVCGLQKPPTTGAIPVQDGLVIWLANDFEVIDNSIIWNDLTENGYNATVTRASLNEFGNLVSNPDIRVAINKAFRWRSFMVITDGVVSGGYIIDGRDGNSSNASSYAGYTGAVPIGSDYNKNRIICDGVVLSGAPDQLPLLYETYYLELKTIHTNSKISLLNHPTLSSNEGTVAVIKAYLFYDRVLTEEEILQNIEYGKSLI